MEKLKGLLVVFAAALILGGILGGCSGGEQAGEKADAKAGAKMNDAADPGL